MLRDIKTDIDCRITQYGKTIPIQEIDTNAGKQYSS